ncbi:hypothetical protein ACOSQ3_016115 [Xanthoceras sorbifolium]
MERRRQDHREYEDFVPSTGWVREPEYDTLVVYLPGFKKEQLKVQVTTLRNLRISGERPLGNNKWSHFRMEFPIPANNDINEISAKFEGGSLYIKHPKVITTEDIPKPQREREESKTGEGEEKKATLEKVPSKPKTEGEEEAKMQEVASRASMEKQKSGEEKENAQQVPPKTSSEEKQPTEKEANGDAKSTLEKKSEDLAGQDEKISAETTEMDKTLGQAGIVSGKDKSEVEGGGSAMEMKQPSKLLNLIVAILLILVIGIYARNAIRSIGKSNKATTDV